MVLDDLDADRHQSPCREPLRQWRETPLASRPARSKMNSPIWRAFFNVLALELRRNVASRGGNTYRNAAEGGGMGSGGPIHDIGAGNHGRKRQARGDALGGAKNVGFEAGMIARPPPCRCWPMPLCTSSLTSMMPCGGGRCAGSPSETQPKRRGKVAALSLKRLDYDGGDLVRAARGAGKAPAR